MQGDSSSGAMKSISRRTVLESMAGVAAASALPKGLMGIEKPAALAGTINPKWYGFNLMEYFSTEQDWMKHFPYKNDGMFQENDFKWMRDWGFNFVRLPMDYRFWTDPNDLLKINEKMVEPIDRAIKLGEKYGVHVNICLHRAPGFCVLDGCDEKATGIHVVPEKFDLYTDKTALDAFVYQWVYFAKRYAGISNEKVSFNLVNEPRDPRGVAAHTGLKGYVQAARSAITAIRGVDPQRLIVSDGYDGGVTPIPGLFDAGIMQSAHDYSPVRLTHYKCVWARPDSDTWPAPSWPLKDARGQVIADKQTVAKEYSAWGELARHGVPIHFGEMGCNRLTPPELVYAWTSDTLDMVNSLHSGWAFWNFRGVAGVLDTNRPGTEYRNWHGHQLDFKMLKLLQSKMKV
jgi:endoglucanase